MDDASLDLWTNGTDWFWAHGEDDAETLYCEHHGIEPDDVEYDNEWSTLDDERPFAVHTEERADLRPPPGTPVERHGADRWSATATVAEWRTVAERGFFASLEW